MVHMLDKKNLNRKPLHNHRCCPHAWVIVFNIKLRNLVTRPRRWSKSQRKLHLFDPSNLLVFILFELVSDRMAATREPNLTYYTTTTTTITTVIIIIIICYWDMTSSYRSWVNFLVMLIFFKEKIAQRSFYLY